MRLRSGHARSTAPRGRSVLGRHWREVSWCAVDLELTGLDPGRDHIIAIGAVPIDDGEVDEPAALYTLVSSSRESGPEALEAHNLRPEDLEGAPGIDEALALLLERMSGRVPVFHCASIERAFLGPLLAARKLRLGVAADTEVLGRLLLAHRREPVPSGMPLTRLARMIGREHDRAHHALADALVTARAFVAVVGELDRFERQTVGRLVRAEDRFRGGRRFGGF